METELKLAVAAAHIDELKHHPLLSSQAGREPEVLRQIDTYYDTPEFDLWRHGFALRVRAVDGQWIQTVKDTGTSTSGLHARQEWECALPDANADLDRLTGLMGHQQAAAKVLRSSDWARRLRPAFTISTTRTRWNLHLPDGSEVECALDVGRIQGGGHQARFSELELELKRGEPACLFELAFGLHGDTPLAIENASKAERGYALLDQRHAPMAVKAEPVRLTRSMPLEKAFQRIGLHCLNHIDASRAGVVAHDVESLHQMRVGLRRLRAALSLFDGLIALPVDVQEGLDWLSAKLGAARDWDVLGGSTLDLIAPGDEGEALDALRLACSRHAYGHYQTVVAALRSKRYSGIMLEINGWMHGRRWRGGLSEEQARALRDCAVDGMRPMLEKAERRLRKRARAANDGDARTRHRMRIAAKKARYAADFFLALLPPRRGQRYIARLSELQDSLGVLNDIAVGNRLLDKLGKDAPQLQLYAGFARGYLTAVEGRRIRKLKRSLAEMASARMVK